MFRCIVPIKTYMRVSKDLFFFSQIIERKREIFRSRKLHGSDSVDGLLESRALHGNRAVENHWVGENTCSVDRYDRSLRELHLSWTTSRGGLVAQLASPKIRTFIRKTSLSWFSRTKRNIFFLPSRDYRFMIFMSILISIIARFAR